MLSLQVIYYISIVFALCLSVGLYLLSYRLKCVGELAGNRPTMRRASFCWYLATVLASSGGLGFLWLGLLGMLKAV